MEIMSFKPTRSHCYNLPVVVTGHGASFNTENISQNIRFSKYSIDGGRNTKQKYSNFDIKARARIKDYVLQDAK